SRVRGRRACGSSCCRAAARNLYSPLVPPTLMRQEIAEQGVAVAAPLTEVRRRAGDLRGAMEGRRRVLLVARGSSDNAAVYARYLVETHLGVPAELAPLDGGAPRGPPGRARGPERRTPLPRQARPDRHPGREPVAVRADRGDRRGPALGRNAGRRGGRDQRARE